MGRRLRPWILCCALLAQAAPAVAQLAPGEIVVRVTDAATHEPVDAAIVVLLGADVPESSLTGKDGTVTFYTVQVGSYALEVKKDGYESYDVADVEVGDGRRVRAEVALQATLKTIATVVAKASASVSSSEINADSAERKISADLKDALGKLAGVTIDDATYGPGSAFGISLNNHDESQTAYSINGIPVIGPGGGTLGTSPLFSGASVSFRPTAGFVAGTIDFQTARPSKYWTYDVSNTIGDFGSSTESGTVTGTAGRLGVALQHAVTRRDANLSGRTYEDQSGLTYLHEAADNGYGDIFNGVYRLDRHLSLTGTAYEARQRYGTICPEFTTIVPCGTGPGTTDLNTNGFASFGGRGLIGNVQVFAGGVASFGSSREDSPGRTIGGGVSPYATRDAYSGSGGDLYASVSAGRHVLSLSGYGGSFLSTETSTFDGTPLTYPAQRQRTLVLGIGLRVDANDGLALGHELSVTDVTGSGRSFVGRETADWKPDKDDTVEAEISVGSAEPRFQPSAYVGDAFSASYDCANGSIFAQGGADQPSPQSSMTYALSAVRSFRGGNVKVQASLQSAHGQPLGADVPISAVPASLFPNGLGAYLASLQSVWSDPLICGATPFSTDRIYVRETLGDAAQVTRSVNLSTHFQLGRDVLVLANYGIASAYLSSLDPRLAAPGSFYAVGRQLPDRPLRSAGLTIDGTLSRAGLEWLVNGQFTDVNNGANLPAFTVYTAGLVFHAKVGTMTLLETNVFGTHVGDSFERYQGIDPMPVVGGGTFAFATFAAQPRQWTFTWRIPWHQHVPPAPKPSSSPKPSPSPKA